MLGLGQWVEHCNLTILGFQVMSKRLYTVYCFSPTPLPATQYLAFITSSILRDVYMYIYIHIYVYIYA